MASPSLGLAFALAMLLFGQAAWTQEVVRHRFLALDFMRGKLFYVDQVSPQQSWNMPWGGGVKDMQLIGRHELLVTRSDGFTIYNLQNRAVVREFRNPSLNGIVTARRLNDGRTLLGANAKSDGKDLVTVTELNAENAIVRQVTFPQLRMLRMMRCTPQKTLLLSELEGVAEVTMATGIPEDKRLIRQFRLPRPRNAYMAVRKPDGNTLVSGGYATALFEYASDGTLLRETTARQPQGLRNWFYGGLQILGNGHVVFANWNGHNEKDFNPGWRIIEVDQDGNVVWFWDGLAENAGSINSILVLDHLDASVLNDDVSGILGRQ